jgi:hypothetical protein
LIARRFAFLDLTGPEAWVMSKGMYEIIRMADGEFNIKPKDVADAIPEDQRQVHHDIYRTYNALKLMVEHKVFAVTDLEFENFRDRLLQAAEVGLAADNVKTRDAATAVRDIQADVVMRKGKRLIYSYLSRLGYWALGGSAIAILVHLFVPAELAAIRSYSLVLSGAMVGAWLSVASTRTSVGLDTIFVALLAIALSLFLQEKLITIKIGDIDLASFTSNSAVALILGLIIGITEKALSLKFFERAKKYVVA